MNRRELFGLAIIPLLPKLPQKSEFLEYDFRNPWSILESNTGEEIFDPSDLIKFGNWSEWREQGGIKLRTCTARLKELRRCFYEIKTYLLTLPVKGEVEVLQQKSINNSWTFYCFRKNKNSVLFTTQDEIRNQIEYCKYSIEEERNNPYYL